MKKGMKIFFGSDHAGLSAKNKLIRYLDDLKIEYMDLGPFVFDVDDDYPDYAFRLAEKVRDTENSLGVLVCGTGEGMVIAANKVRGIRAVNPSSVASAKMSREHNDANVITFGAREMRLSKMKKILLIWINSEFSKKERHKRRIRKIKNYEINE